MSATAGIQQPLGTVKTWVRSALKVLREQLTEAAGLFRSGPQGTAMHILQG